MLYLLGNFFTHKDFLPQQLAGTLFTPLHFLVAFIFAVAIIFLGVFVSKKSEKTIKTIFICIWAALCVFEISKILWETFCGSAIFFEAAGILPLYPCSIFMYAMPLAIWGNEKIKYMGCGYVCSLGLLGGLINFVYPANVLSNYSCISFAGFHTFFYHGSMVFTALVMLLSGYHSYKKVTKWYELLFPAVPALVVSVAANIVNFSPVNSDYMFFKLNSFFFAPLGAALPKAVCVIIVYILYLVIHILPYIPHYINRQKRKLTQ